MIPLVCLALLASSARLQLVNEEYRIPAREWRYVELGLKQRPALVDAAYEVRSGPEGVRLVIVRGDDLAHMRAGESHGEVASTRRGRAGRIEYPVARPGEYALIVDNRAGSEAVFVRLRIWLDFANLRRTQITTLDPRRQLAVVLASFAFFFGVVTWSARRLLRYVKR